MSRTRRRNVPSWGVRLVEGPWRDERHGKNWPALKEIRRRYERQARTAARVALQRGEEPAPYRTRGSAKWDCW